MSARRRASKFGPLWFRIIFIVVASTGAIVLAIVLVGPSLVPGAISAQLHDKHALDGSTVRSGNIAAFVNDIYSAQLILRPKSIDRLLASDQVFAECGNGLMCDPQNGWRAVDFQVADAVQLPGDAMCATSSPIDDLGPGHTQIVCISQNARSLYYFGLGGR